MPDLMIDDVKNTAVSPPQEDENVEVLRARIRALEESQAADQALIAKMRRKDFDASLEKLVAHGLKAATFKALPDGRIVVANDHATDLCGPVFEQGANLYSLIIDRLSRPSGLMPDDGKPKSFGQTLREAIDATMQVTRINRRARRPSEGLETEYTLAEQLVYQSPTGPIRVLLAMSYVRDHNSHPWIQLTMVNLETVNLDDLTGLWRRSTFDNVLARKIAERRRISEHLNKRKEQIEKHENGHAGSWPLPPSTQRALNAFDYVQPLALLMIDIDHFKKVNDTYGHQAGDDALKAVATRIQRIVKRQGDMVCRYGGEEIAVILDADRVQAESIAQQILNAVRATGTVVVTENGRTSLKMTVSIGGTSFTGADDTASMMVQRADASLYEAKGKKFWTFTPGRNRIVFDGEVLPDPDRKTR
ncbi:MAG: GGDEF domain-containing protein [Patescibacteria group bacterium]